MELDLSRALRQGYDGEGGRGLQRPGRRDLRSDAPRRERPGLVWAAPVWTRRYGAGRALATGAAAQGEGRGPEGI